MAYFESTVELLRRRDSHHGSSIRADERAAVLAEVYDALHERMIRADGRIARIDMEANRAPDACETVCVGARYECKRVLTELMHHLDLMLGDAESNQ